MSSGAHTVRGYILLHSDVYTQAGGTERNVDHIGDLPKALGLVEKSWNSLLGLADPFP